MSILSEPTLSGQDKDTPYRVSCLSGVLSVWCPVCWNAVSNPPQCRFCLMAEIIELRKPRIEVPEEPLIEALRGFPADVVLAAL
jgi:hypothetical protein